MLDMKFIRENPELVKNAIIHKNEKTDLKKVLELDKIKRELQFKFDTMRSEQNNVSKQIPELKNAKKDSTKIIAQMKMISSKLKEISTELSDVTVKLKTELLNIPNIPHTDVPIGDESENDIVREWGEKKEFNFNPAEHLELSDKNKLLDIKRATKLSGSGFVGYTGKGAQLERALINFMLDFHINKHEYEEVSLPILVNRQTMTGTGQLPKLEDDMYHVNEDDLFLVPTAEVSVTNLYAQEILPYEKLPQKYVSYSPCFRREAGSYGKETKGLQRVHQFNKVEMVRFVKPKTSYQVLDEMLNDAEDILKALGLHYRVMNLATGELSFASAKTYDIEVWAPATEKYLEVSSISNFEDFQARRASIRYRNESGKFEFVHTLNGSGLATPRTFIALIETYQNQDGSIEVPSILQPYLSNQNIL
jgi:seryl-tRNA synthetase